MTAVPSRAVVAALAVLLTAGMAAALGRAALPRPGGDAGRYTVARVTRAIDGDTVEVRWLGGPRLPGRVVRLIGVDTPEVGGRAEPYGREAAAFTRRELVGRTVWLERDVSDRDRYGRALRYVWLVEPPDRVDERAVREGMFNARLLLLGYAQVLTVPPDVRYAELFLAFQREARAAGRGLWSLEQEQKPVHRCDPSYPDVCIPPPPPDLDCGDIPYRRFRVRAPDPHGFDRDRDGVGCER